jgi:uncharacterized HAD superfamily protein
MRIGIDIDDCITQTAQNFCSYYAFISKSPLSVKQLTTPNAKFEDTGLVTLEEVKSIKKKYLKDRIFRKIRPYPYSIEVLKKLCIRHKLFFISTRNDYATNLITEDTNHWFNNRGIRDYELILTQDKPTQIKRLKLDLFIEDNLYQITKIRESTNVKILVLERPWNRGNLSIEKVTPVKNWKAIDSFILNDD